MQPTARPLLLALFLPTALGACRSAGGADHVAQLVRDGRFAEAVELAAEQVEDQPGDPEAQRLHLEASLAFVLDQGRQAVFEERLEDALDHFNHGHEIAPSHPTVLLWLGKTRKELTRRWLDAGLEFMLRDELDKALQAYQLALYYTPGQVDALIGTGRVLLLSNYRQGLSEDYYREGIRAVREHVLTSARRGLGIAHHYWPEHPHAVERKDQVESALAEQRMFIAGGFEREGLYGAAKNEYRLVMIHEPGNAEAQAGFERMDREDRAQRFLTRADMLIRQERLEEALLQLEEGRALTELQGDEFTRLVNEIEVVHWEALYQEGVAMEQDFRYVEAIETYDQLLAEAEFYADAANRRDTLVEYVEQTEALWAELEAAGDPEDQLRILREIELLWPEYKDVQTRIYRLTREEP